MTIELSNRDIQCLIAKKFDVEPSDVKFEASEVFNLELERDVTEIKARIEK